MCVNISLDLFKPVFFFPGEMDDVLDSICTFHMCRNFYGCVSQLLVSSGFTVCRMDLAPAHVFFPSI